MRTTGSLISVSLTQPAVVLELTHLAITADRAQRPSKVTRQPKYRGGNCFQERVMHAVEFGCRFEPLMFPARRRYVCVIQHEASETVRHAAWIYEPSRRRLDVPQSVFIKTSECCKSLERRLRNRRKK